MNHKIQCYRFEPDGSVPRLATFVSVSQEMAQGFVHLYMNSGIYDILDIEYEVCPDIFLTVETWERSETHPEHGYRRTR